MNKADPFEIRKDHPLDERGSILVFTAFLIAPLSILSFALIELIASQRVQVLRQRKLDQTLVAETKRVRIQLKSLIESNQRMSAAKDVAVATILAPEAWALLQTEIRSEYLLQESILLGFQLNPMLKVHFSFVRDSPDDSGPGILSIEPQSSLTGISIEPSFQIEIHQDYQAAAGTLKYEPTHSTTPFNPILEYASWSAEWAAPHNERRQFPWFIR